MELRYADVLTWLHQDPGAAWSGIKITHWQRAGVAGYVVAKQMLIRTDGTYFPEVVWHAAATVARLTAFAHGLEANAEVLKARFLHRGPARGQFLVARAVATASTLGAFCTQAQVIVVDSGVEASIADAEFELAPRAGSAPPVG